MSKPTPTPKQNDTSSLKSNNTSSVKQNDTSSLTPKPTAKPNVGIGTTPTTQSYNSQSKK